MPSEPAPPHDNWREELLVAREAIWRNYFSNPDKLAEGVTDDLIAMGQGGPPWQSKAEVVRDSRKAVADGLTLAHLAFPKNEFQRYGDVGIIYTTYEIQRAKNGVKSPMEKGQGTEVFRWDGKRWVHTAWHLGRLQ